MRVLSYVQPALWMPYLIMHILRDFTPPPLREVNVLYSAQTRSSSTTMSRLPPKPKNDEKGRNPAHAVTGVLYNVVGNRGGGGIRRGGGGLGAV